VRREIELDTRGQARTLASASTNHHGKPEEETPPENEQAQAPKALEVESPQEAHVAEIAALAWRDAGHGPIAPAADRPAAGFSFPGRRPANSPSPALRALARPDFSSALRLERPVCRQKTSCGLVLSWRRG